MRWRWRWRWRKHTTSCYYQRTRVNTHTQTHTYDNRKGRIEKAIRNKSVSLLAPLLSVVHLNHLRKDLQPTRGKWCAPPIDTHKLKSPMRLATHSERRETKTAKRRILFHLWLYSYFLYLSLTLGATWLAVCVLQMTPREKCSRERITFFTARQLMREVNFHFRSFTNSTPLIQCFCFIIHEWRVSMKPDSAISSPVSEGVKKKSKLFSIDIAMKSISIGARAYRSLHIEWNRLFSVQVDFVFFPSTFDLLANHMNCLLLLTAASMQVSCKILSLVLNVNNFSLCTEQFISWPAFVHFATCRLLLFFLSLSLSLRLD